MSDVPKQDWWARVDRITRSIETWFIVVVLGGLILLGAGQIILRNFFSAGFFWADGLSRLAVLWLALLGALAASRDGRHITMGALARWMPPKLQVVAAVVADAFGATVSAALAWYSWALVKDTAEFGGTLLAELPAWWFQSIMPAAFGLMALQFVIHAVNRARGNAPAETLL